jgi:serine/threonine protein kinase
VSWVSDEALEHLRAAADAPDLAGTRYALEERIGQGGMGSVYRARDLVLDRDVALKVLDLPGGPQADLRARMIREAQILARLEHPAIVPVHDVGALADGRMFVVMKLVRGESLAARLARSQDLAAELRSFLRICEAVAFAHAHGVIHRDLKPENVMVGSFGEVLVMDWGVAKILAEAEETTAHDSVPATSASSSGRRGGAQGPPAVATRVAPGGTDPGTVLGTPGYMAPEQAEGRVAETDARADVYALGAILYYLLTRKVPDRPPVPPRRGSPEIRRPLEAICLKALASAPGDRYATVEDLAAEVSRYLDGRGVLVYREGPAERVGRFARAYRTPILLVLAYLLMRVLLFLFARA